MSSSGGTTHFQRESHAFVESAFHVRYAETDNMGIVHHSTYLVYCEEGRSQYMRAMGSDYAHVEESGFRLPVTEARLRFSGSLRYGQIVRVRAWIAESLSRRLTFAYEICAGDDPEVLATGFTRHVWTDGAGKVTRLPEIWRSHFRTRAGQLRRATAHGHRESWSTPAGRRDSA